MRQKTLRTFVVENFEKLKNVVESKYDLVKNYFFYLKEENKEIENFLKEKKLNYIVENRLFISNESIRSKEVKVVEKEKIVEKKIKVNTKIYDRIIRSGVEIDTDENLVFLNRINAGAKIKSSGNIEIFSECAGLVICDGDYLIVKKNLGTIIFRGENIGKVDELTLFTKDYKRKL
jgi:septum site-determining protein MinC